MIIQPMSTLECTKLLAASRLGHLGCTKDGQPYVVPIHYAYADHHLYAFSMPGKKVEWMRVNPLVSVLVHTRGEGQEWKSVVIDGRYEELLDRIDHMPEREHAWSILSKHVDWWEPGALKPGTPPLAEHSTHVFYRISIEHLSGREAKAK
ncbi:pyridoxamine 5'-phosphate oxidase family protein [Mesorhizobium helmanticense]|uniref:Flavin-nucleotide-binding protein n=1 Tax=Mesorhizobium helmanticense TaxID=1776423 RepID=A0A2T4IT24_9HYPH|nr:pyridoxamine 5'-phosphate oxidase family protein [Mesorhizobium helmanticense]PTE08787.1 flavin-nucleotide-binding protein [Mesorhizobium helmanticense]